MEELINWATPLLSQVSWEDAFHVVLTLLAIVIVFKVINKAVGALQKLPIDFHSAASVKRGINTACFIVAVFYLLSVAGVDLRSLWASAGIVGIAVGFASQTVMSNFVSGIFVMSEAILKVGDYITVNGVSGTVDSVGLLSTKIHNLDNHLIRIPNALIINDNFQNLTYNGIRRMNFCVSIGRDSDMDAVRTLLLAVPKECPSALKEPAPLCWYDGFSDKGIDVVLAVFFQCKDFLQIKTEVFTQIKRALDKEGVKIGYTNVVCQEFTR